MNRAREEAGRGADFRYCPRCATRLERAAEGRSRPTCPACGFVQYLNPVAVVAGILLSDRDQLPPAGREISPARATHVLLVRRTGTYRGQWCLPCGYLEYDEEIRTAAAREMAEETGLTVAITGVFAVLSNFHRPEAQTVGTWFLTRYESGALAAGDDADRAGFFRLGAIDLPLAFPTDRQVLADLERAATGAKA